MVIGAEGVEAAHPANQRGRGGSIPTSALHGPPFPAKAMRLAMIPFRVAREVCERRHYLHTYPGAAILNFGIFVGASLLGVAQLQPVPDEFDPYLGTLRSRVDGRLEPASCLVEIALFLVEPPQQQRVQPGRVPKLGIVQQRERFVLASQDRVEPRRSLEHARASVGRRQEPVVNALGGLVISSTSMKGRQCQML